MTRRVLGLTEPTWRLLAVALVVAGWWLVAFTHPAFANDCIEYVKNPKNFTAIPKALIEDCMRTGYVQAAVTATIAAIAGGTIAVAVNGAIQTMFPPGTEAPGDAPKPTDTGAPDGPPKDSTPVFENDHCEKCGADLPDPPPADGLCPACHAPNWITSVGPCPCCGKRINLTDGNCSCGCKFTPPTDPNPKFGQPKDPTPVFENDHCEKCGADLPDPPPADGLCPACHAPNWLTTVGHCPRCGKRLNLTDGHCSCGYAFTPPADPNPPVGPPKDPSTVFENDRCQNCGADLPDPPPADGLCPACKAKNWMTTVGKCPRCGRQINLTDGTCPCGAKFTPPPDPNVAHCRVCGADLPVPPPADGRCPACGATHPDAPVTSGGSQTGGSGSSADGSGAGTPPDQGGGAATDPGAPPATPPTSGPATPPPPVDPSTFTNQGTVKGDKAIDLLEQSGLAHVTRDADGKVIKVEEAFPNAFTNLGGETVTMKGGEVTGGPPGSNLVEQSHGRITGIAFQQNPDGSIGDPVVVVNHDDPQWVPRPDTPQEVANQMIQDAQDAANQASKALHDTVKNVEDKYNDLKKNLDDGDLARDAYRIAKFTSGPEAAEQEMRDYAKKNNLDPDQVMQVAKMDKNMWEGIKAAVKLPDTIRAKLPW